MVRTEDVSCIEPLAAALGVSVLEIMKSERIPEQGVSSEITSNVLMDAFTFSGHYINAVMRKMR